MFEDALTYPTRSDDWTGKLLLGGLLGMFAWLIVPLFALTGYYVRTLRATIAGDDELPTFDDWGDLVVEGIKAAAIVLAFLLVPFLLMAIIVGVGGEPGPGGGFVLLLVTLAFYYAVPAGLAAFAERGRLADGFDLDRLTTLLTSSTYAFGWLMALAVSLVIGVITLVGATMATLAASIIGIVPILGWIVAFFIGVAVALGAQCANFYAALAVMRIYGRVYVKVLDVASAESSSATSTGPS
ncbi:DUF4013 domain-containing protein [Haloparvum sp. AD34]